MTYSDDFLEALNLWQNGWREHPERKIEVTNRLLPLAVGLPRLAYQVDTHCFRKRFLYKPDLPSLFLEGSIDEGISSWTLDKKWAANFKGFWRENTFASIFMHLPRNDEVILNVSALWRDKLFQEKVESFRKRHGNKASALLNFKDTQGEVILNSPLIDFEVVGFTGKGEDFSKLCVVAGVEDEKEQQRIYKVLIDQGIYPDEAIWIDEKAAQRVMKATRSSFEEKLRQHLKNKPI